MVTKPAIIILFVYSFLISQSLQYPSFPTILTVSMPIPNMNSETYIVESNYVRFLQASGADLLPVHPFTPHETIDYLLTKVNGILIQGNLNDIDITSKYYETIKYILIKTLEINKKNKIKLPLLSIGDGMALILCILNNDQCVHRYLGPSKRIVNTSNLLRNFQPEMTIILSELNKEDMPALDKGYALSNELGKIVLLKDFKKFNNLVNLFDIISTSVDDKSKEKYISILEGKNLPLILLSFHPEFIAFEENERISVPNKLSSIKTARFMGNAFVFYGRKNVNAKMTVEEKIKYNYINPYGALPELINGRYSYVFSEN